MNYINNINNIPILVIYNMNNKRPMNIIISNHIMLFPVDIDQYYAVTYINSRYVNEYIPREIYNNVQLTRIDVNGAKIIEKVLNLQNLCRISTEGLNYVLGMPGVYTGHNMKVLPLPQTITNCQIKDIEIISILMKLPKLTWIVYGNFGKDVISYVNSRFKKTYELFITENSYAMIYSVNW